MKTEASAEIFIRWDQDRIPPPHALGISTVVIPAARPLAVRRALAQGYRVYLEIDAGAAASFKPAGAVAGVIVKGALPSGQLARLSQFPVPVRVAEDRGKWPHIRTNWVTRNKDVLQVTGRSSQPWLENNEALIRIAAERADADAPPVLLTYAWQPVTVSDLDQGPRLEHYLVAMAEAGSFGADLLLPLHERFERALIMGDPDARADWDEMRRFLDFYAWNVPGQHRPIANVGVVTADPMRAFEVMNLLARHNLPFVSIGPATVGSRRLADLDLVIVLDDLDGTALQQVTQFATGGGTVLVAGTSAVRNAARPPEGVRPGSDPGLTPSLPWRQAGAGVSSDKSVSYTVGKGRVIERQDAPVDPNTFALEMRQLLGTDRRVVDIWNGITVLVAPFAAPAGDAMVLTAINYAAQPLPVQVRVRGTFSEVQLEAPGQPAIRLPFEQRNGGTEFVLPALRVGGRVFLNRFP